MLSRTLQSAANHYYTFFLGRMNLREELQKRWQRWWEIYCVLSTKLSEWHWNWLPLLKVLTVTHVLLWFALCRNKILLWDSSHRWHCYPGGWVMEHWEIQFQAGAEFLGKPGHSIQRGLREDTNWYTLWTIEASCCCKISGKIFKKFRNPLQSYFQSYWRINYAVVPEHTYSDQ